MSVLHRSDFVDLFQNIRAGLPLALLQPVRANLFHASIRQIVLLFATHLTLAFGWYYLLADQPRAFFPTAIAVHALWLLSIPVVGCLAWRETSSDEALLVRVTTMLLAPMATGWVFYAGFVLFLNWKSAWLDALLAEGIWGVHFFVPWVAAVFATTLRSGLGLPLWRSGSLCAIYAIGLLISMEALSSPMIWYTEYVESETTLAEVPRLDVERILYAQPERLAFALSKLAPERPGTVDLYLLAFGADSRQDVFRNEVTYVRELFDRRFDTANRSLVLVNHRETVETVPIASITNLAAALEGIGRILNPEEDILLLYITSHGSRAGEVRVRFPRFPLNHVGPDELNTLIDKSGIRWPAIIVSACYSGSFVEELAEENSMVITSAASDRASFGCSDDAGLTYFARAYFERQLEKTYNFVAAFSAASTLISQWENERELTPSNPRFFVGAAMDEKLGELLARLEEASLPLVARLEP